jgi:hypothetical protein
MSVECTLLRVALIHVAVFALGLACSREEPDPAPAPPASKFACRFQVRFSSCQDTEGSQWTDNCVTVPTATACQDITTKTTELVGSCEFKTDYREILVDAGECAPKEAPKDAGPAGSSCAAHESCSSGLCMPQYYCTRSCSAYADCAADFPGGCCVGGGSLGYCLAAKECAAFCPTGAHASGLPTVCTCPAPLHLNETRAACIQPAALGEWCQWGSDCVSKFCLRDERGPSWCSRPCGTDADCTGLVRGEISRACCRMDGGGFMSCTINQWCA